MTGIEIVMLVLVLVSLVVWFIVITLKPTIYDPIDMKTYETKTDIRKEMYEAKVDAEIWKRNNP